MISIWKALFIQSVMLLAYIKNSAGTATKESTPHDNCYGKHKMPLNEKTIQIQERRFESFSFVNFDKLPIKAGLRHYQQHLEINLEYKKENIPTVYGGPVDEFGNYSLSNMYWYGNEHFNEDHNLDGISFPAEFHLAFYNTKHPHLRRASYRKYGAMVLAFPFKVVENPNSQFFKTLTQYLYMVRMDYDYASIPLKDIPLLFEAILQTNLSTFYTYHANTLENRCFRDVIYFDFFTPLEIDVEFVEQIQYIETDDGIPLMKIAERHGPPPNGIVIKSNPYASNDAMEIKNLRNCSNLLLLLILRQISFLK
ncbi:carbonic anhydrase 9-like [Musca autumnalis]|uniref:carbonic anhydrase 9-like n=1 Tax=Musca autumnalis TaxID=221902 RepID=UPI003CEF016E